MKPDTAVSDVAATQPGAHPAADEHAVRALVQDETDAWNRGDAATYCRHFAAGGTFTNIRGEFLIGHDAFLRQHEMIFQGMFRQTSLQQDVVSLEFVAPDVAVVESVSTVTGVGSTAPGTVVDAQGRLRTRLLQVVARQGGQWRVVAYHNVDVKPGVAVPEPGSP